MSRKAKMVTVEGPCKEGTLVPKPPFPRWVPRQERFYNPAGEHFIFDLPYDEWLECLLKDGDVRLVTRNEPPPIAEKKKDSK
jgi:hypothetical protein